MATIFEENDVNFHTNAVQTIVVHSKRQIALTSTLKTMR